MAEFDVVQYLASKGKVGRQGSGSEVQYPCFFDCNEPADSRKKKLYVNAEDGVYTCFVCGASGGTYLLQKHFGDDPKVAPVEGADPFTRRKILNWAAETGSAMLAHNDDLLLVLMNDRGLSPETILERKLGFIGHGWSLTGSLPETFTRKELEGTGLVHKAGVRTGQDFFYSHLLIPYTSRGHVVQMRGKGVGTTAGGKYMTGPEEQVYLFNTDSLDAADDVIITEGEFDAIALEQHLKGSPEDRVRSIGVVGLAGANGFKDGFESYFNLAKRVYIGLDPDDTGRRAAVQIKEKLGSRARILELPTELPKCDWCADEETEALTRRGWLRYDEVEAGDEVWSVDPATGFASWASVAAVFRERRQRTMVRLEAATHDSLTTPDHRWLTQRGFVTTSDLRPSDRLPMTAPSLLPTVSKHDDDLVELVAWYYTEGHVRSAGVSIAQCEPKANRLRALMSRMFGPAFGGSYMDRLSPCWRERRRSWDVIEFDLNAQAARELRQLCPDKTPSDEFLQSLTAAQLDLFIDVSVDCDGWRKGAQRFFAQADAGRRDAFVTACALRGLATRVAQRIPSGYGRKSQWVVTVLQRTEARVASLRRSEVDYSGVIWCPSVPGRSTWFARRNGKSYFTGNTEFLLPVPMDATDEWHREHPHAGHGWQDVLALLGNASGKRVFMMSEIGVSWRNQQEAGPRIMTGYTQLDAVLQGFIPGQVLIFLAKTGTGKTIMLCNLAYLMRDRPTLFISLEMTKEEVYERLRRIYLFHHPTATDQTIEFALSKIAICDENQLGDKDFKLLIDEYEVELGERPEIVHVDYLGYYARGQQGMGPYEKSSNAVMQLKREAKQNRVLIISPSQVNRGASEGKPIDLDDARDSGTIEETADFLLSIWRPDDALKNGDDGSLPINIQQSGRLKVDVLKSRHGGKGKTITLLMDLLTLCIVSDGTPSAKRVAHHNYLAWRGETWDQMRHSELVELARGTQLQIGV